MIKFQQRSFFFKTVHFFLDDGIQNWFLLKSPWPTLIIAICYLLLVSTILPFYMKKREEYVLKKTIFFYNLFAMVLNFYIIYKIASAKFRKNDFTLCSNIRMKDEEVSLLKYLIFANQTPLKPLAMLL